MGKMGGAYVLVLALNKSARISVGRLGELPFPAGYYVYVGSALGGIRGRLKRHLGGIGRPHWHIDYLRPRCEVVDIWYGFSGERRECAWAEAAARLPGMQVIAPRFGSSDCRCPSHLFYSSNALSFEAFKEALPQADAIAQIGAGSIAGELRLHLGVISTSSFSS